MQFDNAIFDLVLLLVVNIGCLIAIASYETKLPEGKNNAGRPSP